MKAKLTKVLSLILVVIMAMGLMTGCSTSSSGKGTKTQDGNKVLFSYDGTDVPLDLKQRLLSGNCSNQSR